MIKRLIAVLFVLVYSPVFGQGFVQVFVTSSDFETNGNLEGLGGGDDQCNAAASAASLSGTWTAWLSDTTADAKNRIPDAEYRLLDGVVVANDVDDLTDGSLDNPIDVDETGASLPAPVKVWTGTRTDGTVGLSHCSNWTSDSGITCAPGVPNANCAFKGSSDAVDGQWTTEALPGVCGAPRALYCFSDMVVTDLIFEDGFESEDTSAWSETVP